MLRRNDALIDSSLAEHVGASVESFSRSRLRDIGEELGATGMQRAESLKLRIGSLIHAELHRVEKLIQDATRSQYACVDRLSQRAAAMGGKRMRPMLVQLSALAAGGSHLTSMMQRELAAISASVELVHAASLVHDDVMDGAEERRHQPTISRVAGNSQAILLGDFLFTKAYALAASCTSTIPARHIASAATALCEGELRQQESEGNWATSKKEYLSIIRQKTAALCAASCRLGAWRGGASREARTALGRYGNYLGVAFQIHDDWLDYWGTERVGKTLGTDLAQAKPTLPLIRLLQTLSPEQKVHCKRLLLGDDERGHAEVHQMVCESDAGEYTLRMAHRFAERAYDCLENLPESPALACLRDLAAFSVSRSE